MILLADITRCWDAGCMERTACRRWLERESGTVHAQSLFPYDEDIGNGCSLRIPPITTETMSNNDHPITPPPELVEQLRDQWIDESQDVTILEHIATQSARWGADQELEACLDEIYRGVGLRIIDHGSHRELFCSDLRAARRPKPLSLKAQAIAVLDDCSDRIDAAHENIIRRALEQLDG